MFGCSKEPSHRDGSSEYQQHLFWFIKHEETCFQLLTLILSPHFTISLEEHIFQGKIVNIFLSIS